MLLLSLSFFFASDAFAGFVDHLARTDDIGPAKVPHQGSSRILVIPVNLDTAHRKRLDMQAIRRFFTDEPGRFTFPGYWRVNSVGRFRVEADVARPVNFKGCPLPLSQKGCTPRRGDVTAAAYGIPLVHEILRRAKAESELDFRRYDTNGPAGKPDGYADGVVILLNGEWFGVALPFGVTELRLALTLDGVTVTMAALASGPRALPMSVHEFGHLLGFADLYDEWKRTYGTALTIMGAWRYEEGDVPLLDPFSRMQAGWAEVIQVRGTLQALIPPADSGAVYRLGSGREFFLVENRRPRGPYDRAVGRPGLAVYHVNLDRLPSAGRYDFVRTVADCPNCRRWRPFIMNVPADRLFESQYRLRPFDPGDLFRTGDALLPKASGLRLSPSNVWFASNAYSGRYTGVSITEIDSDSMLPSIRATLQGPESSNACREIRCPSDRTCLHGSCVKTSDFAMDSGVSKTTSILAARPAFAPALENAPADAASVEEEAPDEAVEFGPDWRLISFLPLVLWFLFRNRLRRRVEKRMKRNGVLEEDAELKNRF